MELQRAEHHITRLEYHLVFTPQYRRQLGQMIASTKIIEVSERAEIAFPDVQRDSAALPPRAHLRARSVRLQ